MPEVKGVVEAALCALLAGGGADGVLEWLTGSAQCYRAIKALTNLSKGGLGLQEESLDRAEQGVPWPRVGAPKRAESGPEGAAARGLRRKAEHLSGEASGGLFAVSRRALGKVFADTYNRRLAVTIAAGSMWTSCQRVEAMRAT